MNVRMNSHLQAPQLRLPDLIRTLINPEVNIQAIASRQYIARMPYMETQLVIKDRVRKGDHRHLGKNERQQDYRFTTLEQLIMDFEADVFRLTGGENESDY